MDQTKPKRQTPYAKGAASTKRNAEKRRQFTIESYVGFIAKHQSGEITRIPFHREFANRIGVCPESVYHYLMDIPEDKRAYLRNVLHRQPGKRKIMKLSFKEAVERLQGLEETIIFKLIARAQYRHNPSVYEKGKSGFLRYPQLSLFEARLFEEEQMDARFGRFTVPEERPFNKNLPRVERNFQRHKTELKLTDFNDINLTGKVKAAYLQLVPLMCKPGDDKHYGSSVEHDVAAIRAISERIHYGAYIAECKFQINPEQYTHLIEARDADGLMQALTRKQAEEDILERIRTKTKRYQKDINPKIRVKIEPEVIEQFYREQIFPLTKEVQVLYFLSRKKNS